MLGLHFENSSNRTSGHAPQTSPANHRAGIWELALGLINARIRPTFLLDGSSVVHAANKPARALLEEGMVWRGAIGHEIRHHNRSVTAELNNRLRLLLHNGIDAPQRSMCVVGQDDEEQCVLILTRILSPDQAEGAGELQTEGGFVLVTLYDRSSHRSDEVFKILNEAFTLTHCEARAAYALVSGYSLKEYSQAAEVKLSTVRWHLRNTLAKTNCANQKDLVRRLAPLFDN